MKHTDTRHTPATLDILHHVGVINTDLDALSECYEKLGFLLTPLSIPKIIIEPGADPVSLGIGNRHAVFENNYLELLGIVDPQQWERIPKDRLGPYNITISLGRYQGLHVMHFGTDHIDLVRERFREQGIPCSEIKNFQRNVQTDKGEQIMRARTLSFPAEMIPEGLLQVAQHDTPELIFQPRYMVHGNGAVALRELVLCCDDPEELVNKYERLTSHRAVKIEDRYHSVDLGHSRIIVINTERLAGIVPGAVPPTLPFMAAITVETINLQLTRNVLVKNEISFTETGGQVIVNAGDAGGCAVIFRSR